VEQRLGVVQRPDAGQQPLVEQCLADGSLRVAPKVGQGGGQIPVGTEQIRAEMPDERAFVRRGHEIQHAEAGADAGPLGGAEDSPDAVLAQLADRDLVGPRHPPLAVHAQVAVQRHTRVQPLQHVLAAGYHLGGGGAAQVDGGQGGPAQVADRHDVPGQRLVQSVGGAPHGVALRHGGPPTTSWSRLEARPLPGACR
jgi:hypothetical protein